MLQLPISQSRARWRAVNFSAITLVALFLIGVNVPDLFPMIGVGTAVFTAAGLMILLAAPVLSWAFAPWVAHRRVATGRYVLLSTAYFLERSGTELRVHQAHWPILKFATPEERDPIHALAQLPALVRSGALKHCTGIVIPAGFVKEKHLKRLGCATRAITPVGRLEALVRLLFWMEVAVRRRVLGRSAHARTSHPDFQVEGVVDPAIFTSGNSAPGAWLLGATSTRDLLKRMRRHNSP